MYKNVVVVIPALEKNRYSENGDLVRFGDLTLLEWKIAQVKNLIKGENIFISTPSPKIAKIAKAYGINIIKRHKIDMSRAIVECVKEIDKEIIIWTHVTSPFVSAIDFDNMLKKFLKLGSGYDSLISVSRLQEYIIFKNQALNFEMTKVVNRDSLKPVYKITNGCFIARKDIYIKYKNYFGIRPYLYEIDMLASMEIKDITDLTIASDLISLFFKKELQI